jgi:hypothetical protein
MQSWVEDSDALPIVPLIPPPTTAQPKSAFLCSTAKNIHTAGPIISCRQLHWETSPQPPSTLLKREVRWTRAVHWGFLPYIPSSCSDISRDGHGLGNLVRCPTVLVGVEASKYRSRVIHHLTFAFHSFASFASRAVCAYPGLIRPSPLPLTISNTDSARRMFSGRTFTFET